MPGLEAGRAEGGARRRGGGAQAARAGALQKVAGGHRVRGYNRCSVATLYIVQHFLFYDKVTAK